MNDGPAQMTITPEDIARSAAQWPTPVTVAAKAQTLKPCPFDGSKRVRLTEKRKGNYRREGSYWQGLCGACFARGPLKQSEAEAIEAWNNQRSAAQ